MSPEITVGIAASGRVWPHFSAEASLSLCEMRVGVLFYPGYAGPQVGAIVTQMPARNYIELVEKTIRVLEVLSRSGMRANLRYIAAEAHLVKSSAFRILFTLKELGYVRQADKGDYVMTGKIRGLRRQASTSVTLVSLARPRMIWLRDEVREGVWLAEWHGKEASLVSTVDAPVNPHYIADVGSPCLLHATATGKAIAAFLPLRTLRDALGPGRLPRPTNKTIHNRTRLRAELQKVRSQGFAINDGESSEGMFGVGAPIFDATGSILASISIVLAEPSSKNARLEKLIRATRSAAESISQDLASVGFTHARQSSVTLLDSL